MTKNIGERGRDAVLHEKIHSKHIFLHQHGRQRVFWEKIVSYFRFIHGAPSSRESERSQKSDVKLDQKDLALIYTKLIKSCDEGETELKNAIKYGLKIIAGCEHSRSDSKADRGDLIDDQSSREGHAFRHH